MERKTGSNSITFTAKNNCPYTVWPGVLTSSGSAASSTGFVLPSGASSSVRTQSSWSGRFWPRTHCSGNTTRNFKCATGDCGSNQVSCNGAGGAPPATLVEFTLNGGGFQDYYDISLVDGFNVPMSVTPQKSKIVNPSGCVTTSCPSNVNRICPPELTVKGSNGSAIACKSACLAFNKSEYCCTGDHSTAKTCPPTRYSRIFKKQCPQAYSYAFDDTSSTFTCKTGGDYVITFCP
ncbi:hypothetical protein Ancab_014488 [Ancistrocladus abbreviatus]